MQCIICGKILIKITKSQTCSRKCNATFQNKEKAKKFIPNKCKQCGSDCHRTSRSKFCSNQCQTEFFSGENHYNWKGGKTIRSDGYISLLRKNHPASDIEGRILEHRLIVEDYLKFIGSKVWLEERDGDIFLKRSLVIHHINGIKDDNRLSNLYICDNQSEHLDIEQGRKIINSSNILGA